jgi:hypothetical protein
LPLFSTQRLLFSLEQALFPTKCGGDFMTSGRRDHTRSKACVGAGEGVYPDIQIRAYFFDFMRSVLRHAQRCCILIEEGGLKGIQAVVHISSHSTVEHVLTKPAVCSSTGSTGTNYAGKPIQSDRIVVFDESAFVAAHLRDFRVSMKHTNVKIHLLQQHFRVNLQEDKPCACTEQEMTTFVSALATSQGFSCFISNVDYQSFFSSSFGVNMLI